jgi:hypothetical protein
MKIINILCSISIRVYCLYYLGMSIAKPGKNIGNSMLHTWFCYGHSHLFVWFEVDTFAQTWRYTIQWKQQNLLLADGPNMDPDYKRPIASTDSSIRFAFKLTFKHHRLLYCCKQKGIDIETDLQLDKDAWNIPTFLLHLHRDKEMYDSPIYHRCVSAVIINIF